MNKKAFLFQIQPGSQWDLLYDYFHPYVYSLDVDDEIAEEKLKNSTYNILNSFDLFQINQFDSYCKENNVDYEVLIFIQDLRDIFKIYTDNNTPTKSISEIINDVIVQGKIGTFWTRLCETIHAPLARKKFHIIRAEDIAEYQDGCLLTQLLDQLGVVYTSNTLNKIKEKFDLQKQKEYPYFSDLVDKHIIQTCSVYYKNFYPEILFD